MGTAEPKKLALLRTLQILQQYSDAGHVLTQDDIVRHLYTDYGITVERKSVGRNLSLLKEAGVGIESGRFGSYLCERPFENSELRLLIDSVLASKHISARQSQRLIEKLCALTNRYFRRNVRHIHTVDQWDKTENKELFLNIELVDEAIESDRMVEYDYNKYGVDKKLHKSSFQRISPYQLILHNQRYYLMGYSSYWKHMVYHRLDRITHMQISERSAVPLRTIEGYADGIHYKDLATAMPYMYTDTPEVIVFLAPPDVVDQVVDWFGQDIGIEQVGEQVRVTVRSSPTAMLFWAMQYADCVKIVSPQSLQRRVCDFLRQSMQQYEEISE